MIKIRSILHSSDQLPIVFKMMCRIFWFQNIEVLYSYSSCRAANEGENADNCDPKSIAIYGPVAVV